MGLNVASVKSYVSSALTTTLFGSGVGEREVGKLTSIIMNKMLFAQGWQFSVEVDGLEGADFFAKDITYHDYSIEYETIKIGGGNILQPTERSPGQITMMVRDTVDGLVLDWFKTAKSRVINPDGTGNIPSKYLLNVRIYRLLSSGLTKLENEMTVFPVTTGDVTYARDQVTEFKSFPMTFALHSTFSGTTNAQFTYINHGGDYAPGWRRDYSTKNQQPAFALGQTGSTVGNDKAVGWNSISGVYNATIGGASTLILHFNMNAGSCPAVQFRVNYKNGGIFYRSARDGYGFEADWSEFYTTTRKPSAGDVGAYTKAECNSRFITGIRLGTKSSVQTWNGPGWNDKSGYVVTASINSNKDELIDTTQARPVQYCINGTWYNAGSI